MSFHVGQKVVCIEQLAASKRWPSIARPTKGEVYTVSEIFSEPSHHYAGKVFLRLVEINNAAVDTDIGPYIPAFCAECFRPVKNTSIEIFRAMLVTPKQPVSA